MSVPILLFGGTSSERKVSVASAQHILAVLACECWFIAPDGALFRVEPSAVRNHARAFEQPFTPEGAPTWAALSEAVEQLSQDATLLLALHGGEGENGDLQRLLETKGVAFTGSGSEASAKAFDKVRAKEIVARAGVRIAESVRLSARFEDVEPARALLARAGRIILKPVADGSSIGLHQVTTEAELSSALEQAVRSGIDYLAEPFVAGTELTVGVVTDAQDVRALPVSEVRVEAGGTFDYAGKYLGKGTRELTPAEVPEEVSNAAQRMALEAHAALGCAGYSRTDLIATAEGCVFLELNTLPGLTQASFIPQQLAAEGTSFAAFLHDQLELARNRRNAAAVRRTA